MCLAIINVRNKMTTCLILCPSSGLLGYYCLSELGYKESMIEVISQFPNLASPPLPSPPLPPKRHANVFDTTKQREGKGERERARQER